MILIPILFFLCWGSFLNMLSWRLIKGAFHERRSFCPRCKHTLAWYDLIPVISYTVLLGKCRYCRRSISYLYPLVELLTTASLTRLWIYEPHEYFFPYFIFFSALIVTFRTDAEHMLISRFVTLFLLPFALICAATDMLHISLLESIFGAILGYGFLWIVAFIFYLRTGKEGMGQGDFELMALIGAFLGPIGCWITLLGSSITGSIFGLVLIALGKQTAQAKIPFGSFLALTALIVTFIYPYACQFFFNVGC